MQAKEMWLTTGDLTSIYDSKPMMDALKQPRSEYMKQVFVPTEVFDEYMATSKAYYHMQSKLERYIK